MIYTLSVAPSVDYHFDLDDTVHPNAILRGHHARFSPGGKGINVSRVLCSLGVKTKALGFLAGRNGRWLTDMLVKEGVPSDFINIEGETRINVKVNSKDGETAFNLDGPVILQEHLEMLYEKLDRLEASDILVLGGSIGRSSKDLYKKIILRYGQKFLCCLDAKGEALKEGVKAKPFLIKPNKEEFEDLIGRKVELSEVPELGKSVQEKYGISYVLISLGADGACLVTPAGVYQDRYTEFSRSVVSTVGAGDTLLASFLSKIAQGENPAKALHFGLKTAALTCYLGHIPSKEDIESNR